MKASTRIIAAVLLLAACAAPVRWHHASLPEDQWRRDEAACNRRAMQKVDRETALSDTVAGNRGSGQGAAYENAMARVAAAKRVRALVAACMTAGGYER
ncbi:MAG: hypothetical protein QGF38_10710 [Rhodospirillales bacterium]|jgi:hypothetical protein|nr:hypothetical protein [Rhodospirillales bacterium]HJO96438.1 hypothetical protein [Rhodospirillales bacterium]